MFHERFSQNYLKYSYQKKYLVVSQLEIDSILEKARQINNVDEVFYVLVSINQVGVLVTVGVCVYVERMIGFQPPSACCHVSHLLLYY